MAAISLFALREYCHYLVVSSNIRRKRRQDEEEKQSDEAAIRDLVLTICPTIYTQYPARVNGKIVLVNSQPSVLLNF